MGSHLPSTSNLPIPQMFVEFAHIYADDIWGEEQEVSLDVMKGYLDRESNSDSLVVSAILIDDLHVVENTLDVNEFIRCILRRGLAPDHVVFEGRLGPVAAKIISGLPEDRLVWQNFKGGKRVLCYRGPDGLIGLLNETPEGEEYTCALLSAAWSLCRAGVYEFPNDAIIRLTEAPVVGDKIVSVLHEKYRGVEAKVQMLIAGLELDQILPRLDLVFFT